MKQLKDYLHFYLGCEVSLWNDSRQERVVRELNEYILYMSSYIGSNDYFDPKPILRPLTDITEEEQHEYNAMTDKNHDTPESFKFLLSKHLDLFELIEAGLAIDKTTIKVEAE